MPKHFSIKSRKLSLKIENLMDSSLSAELIGSNEDLIIQIFIRLPVKSLLLFKSVSKHWLSLISDPHFSRLHTLCNPNLKPSGLFLRSSPLHFKFLSLYSPSPSPSPLPFDFFQNLKILQSCNGLLLCSSLPQLGQSIKTYYVSNPTTKQSSALPSLITHQNATIFGLNLACKSCNYEVVCVRSTANSIYHHQIEIYHSEIGAWRPSGSPFVAPFDMVFDNGVYWNGCVHWISPTGNALCFDVDKERIFNMPKPPFSDGWGKRRLRYFGESGGHLYLIEIYGNGGNQFNVYEMEKDYSNWRIGYQVQLDEIVNAFPEMIRRRHPDAGGDSSYYSFVVLSVVENALLLHIPGKLISYNLKHKTFKKVCELNDLQFGWLDAYPYMETLACV